MPLLTVLTRDAAIRAAVDAPPGGRLSVAGARSWLRLLRLVRERPVTAVVIDSGALPYDLEPDNAVRELGRLFPSLSTVFVARPELDPWALLGLGRAGIENLMLLQLDELPVELPRAVRRAAAVDTASQVTRIIGGRLPRRELAAVRAALDGVQLGWSADDLARALGVTRAHLSVRLRSVGLPSAGHLLTWAKMLHAGRWLGEPGRTAQSVSRQLEYSSGAGFRRALHNYVGGTPSWVKEAGGFRFVLGRFLDVSGLGDSLRDGRSVA